jgi:hypothetical protein
MEKLSIRITLASKLASIVVHAEEYAETQHPYDLTALEQLTSDPEVKEWLKEMGPLVPVKRGR